MMKLITVIVTRSLLFTFVAFAWCPNMGYVVAQIPPNVEGVTVTKIDSGTSSNLPNTFFLNEKEGWVLVERHILKTKDGGRSWSKIFLKLAPSEILSKIAFQNSKNGTLIVQKLAGPDDKKNYFKVFQTSDGGMTWLQRRFARDGMARSLIFQDQEVGWIAGYKKRGHSLIGHEYLLLRTNNQGKSWEDLSSKIETEVIGNIKPPNYKRQIKAILGATLNRERNIVLLANQGVILESSNGGNTWSKTQLPDGRGAGIYCCSGYTEDGSLWISSSEGRVGSVYGSIDVVKNNLEVSLNGILNMFFTDVVKLNDQRFIAVGRYMVPKTRKEESIILYTNDDGVTWKTVFHDETKTTFNSIAKLSPQSLIAVGSGGLLVKIDL